MKGETMVGLYDLLAINEKLYVDKTAIIDSDGSRYTYGELGERVNALSHSLYAHGLRPGMRIGIMLRNGIDFVASLYATLKLGCVAVAFPFGLREEEWERYRDRAECTALIFDETFFEDAVISLDKDFPVLIGLQGSGGTGSESGILRFATLLAEGDRRWSDSFPRNPEDDELMLFTSGSSGTPKCVVHTHETAFLFFALPMMSGTVFNHDDIMIYFAPLYHLAGITYLFYMVSLGGTMVLKNRFDEEEVLAAIQREKVTQLVLIPPALVSRLEPHACGYDLASVEWVTMTGGVNDPALVKKVFSLFPNSRVSNTYGQSERSANTIIFFDRDCMDEVEKRASSIGYETQFSQIRLLDDNGSDADAGEAYARCPGMFVRYLGMPTPFVDGWYPTGDVLRRDRDGLLWFVDRTKNMIKTDGENVYAFEVEKVLRDIEEVQDCAVFGRPDAMHGEAIVAVVAWMGEEAEAIQKIQDRCRSTLASHKCPNDIVIVERIPRNELGKLNRKALEGLCAAG